MANSYQVNEILPTPCEGYAFAGCFVFGNHHHEPFDTDRIRMILHRAPQYGKVAPGRQAQRRGINQRFPNRFLAVRRYLNA